MKKILIILCLFVLVACQVEVQEEKPITLKINEPYKHHIEPTDTWLFESEINASYSLDKTSKCISLFETSDRFEAVVLKKEAIYLKKNAHYQISFSLGSDLNREILMMVLNDQDKVIYEEIIESDQKDYVTEFKMPYYDTWNGKVFFYLGKGEAGDIKIDDFMIHSLDEHCIGVRLNQIGYKPDQPKIAAFSFNAGNHFGIYDVNTDELVYTGIIGNGKYDEMNQEYNFQGDFTDFNKSGSYYIQSETGVRSYNFEIASDVYQTVLDDALYFMYLQRCGQAIDDERYGHSACHNQAVIYGYDIAKEVVGGWHDAGDYGRYVQTSTKALADLLMAYDLNRDAFKDERALIDEIRYQLEWLMKMQNEDGSVSNKVTTESFAYLLMPDEDLNMNYILPAWTLTTASFAGSLAFGAMIFEEIDPTFSNELKECALKAGQYLIDVKDAYIIKNPSHFNTGQYNDSNEQDERFYAFSALYRLMEDPLYLKEIEAIFDQDDLHGTLVADMSPYAYYLLLKTEFDDPIYKRAYDAFEKHVLGYYDCAEGQTYFYPLYEYHWGSNQHVLDVANRLLIYSVLSENEKYQEAAYNIGHYVFGNNGLGISFIDGYGTYNPSHIHHRVLQIRGGEMKGAMVGGVDQILLDGNLLEHFNDQTPIAKRYLDDAGSYSTNEFAIYYNSALVLFLSFIN